MKLRRYIWSEWLKIFMITAGLVIGLIIVQEVYNELNQLIDKGASGIEIMLSFLLTVPLFFPSIIPLILLLSIIFSASAMHRKNEIVAMKAAGMSLWKISQPLLLAAAICAGGMLYLNAQFIPWAVQKQESLQRQIIQREQNANPAKRSSESIKNLGSLNFKENKLWLIGHYHKYLQEGQDVTVYEMDPQGKETYRIRSETAKYMNDQQCWKFTNGRELFYDGKTDEPYRNKPFKELIKKNYQDDPMVMVSLRQKPKNLSLYELNKVLAAYKGFKSSAIIPYQVRFYSILASPFSCFLVVIFGLAFAVMGVRTNPMIGISNAFGMFIIYFVISNISTVLGEGGWLPPILAAILPLVLVGIMAVRVFIKAQ